MPDAVHYTSLVDGVKKIYKNKIKPLEESYSFDYFHSPILSDIDIEAKPLVLLLGQYSVGKTTFIEHLLGRPYPGAHIGPEPTTDRFVAVSWGEEERVIPGNVASVQPSLPFLGLSSFGSSFMNKFQVSTCPSPLLQNITLIDTPGVLSGDQQRLGRSYDYVKVCEWFAEKADMILILFDAHKLDISDELKRVLEVSLKGQDEKIKIVLNKADVISQQELMRVYGALMWSLGKVIRTPEVIRVYIGSFRASGSVKDCEQSDLLVKEEKDLFNHLYDLPKNAGVRKVNEVIKRARLLRVHVQILNHLRQQLPSMFGRAAKQEKLCKNLAKEFTAVQAEFNLPVGDFPEYEHFQSRLAGFNLDRLPKWSNRAWQGLETALVSDLPRLLHQFPSNTRLGLSLTINPFTGEQKLDSSDSKVELSFNAIDHENHRRIFLTLNPQEGLISGAEGRLLLKESGLSDADLGRIWTLSDIDKDGCLSFDEFSIALHLIKAKRSGLDLPETLPEAMRP